jgi:hypothetical protein
MNIETREVREISELSEDEKASGKWIPIAKKYIKKQPITDEDFARIARANERMARKAANRARAAARQRGEAE